MTLINTVGTVMTQVVTWIGEVITALVGTDGALAELLPLFAIGIAISVFLFAIKAIRSVLWGA